MARVIRAVLLGGMSYFLPVAQGAGVAGLLYTLGVVVAAYILGIGSGLEASRGE